MLLGWWPVGFADIARCLFLTAILFLGPLFERGVIEGEWHSWVRRNKIYESLSGWIGWRNYVAVCLYPLYPQIDVVMMLFNFWIARIIPS